MTMPSFYSSCNLYPSRHYVAFVDRKGSARRSGVQAGDFILEVYI